MNSPHARLRQSLRVTPRRGLPWRRAWASRWARTAACWLIGSLGVWHSAQASSESSIAPSCGLPAAITPVLSGPALAQQDRLLRLAAAAERVLAAQPGRPPVAMLSRDGTALERVGQRYSHAGLALRDHPSGAYTVRQLYHDCQRGAPALFDQGIAGFLLGARTPWLEGGDRLQGPIHLAIQWLPAPAGARLAATALDPAQAQAMLHPAYSANAYPFSTRYQNCNQWLAELMAQAWGGDRVPTGDRRAAQHWLLDQGHEGTVLQAAWWLRLGAPLMMALSPWMHSDDRPRPRAASTAFMDDEGSYSYNHASFVDSHLLQGDAPPTDPDSLRRTVLPEGLMQWLARRWSGQAGLRRLDLCIAGDGVIYQHEGGLQATGRCESGVPMQEGPGL